MFELIGPAIVIGVILDLLLGDPEKLYHPVVLMGRLISFSGSRFRSLFPATEQGERRAGLCMVILVSTVCLAVPAALLTLAFAIHWIAGFAVMCWMCYRMIAAKSLRKESMNVYSALGNGTLDDGRQAVARIVGRDTEALDETGVVKAAVETVAENFSDGVVAPVFYMLIGGPALMYLYKGVNTMDSMVGYKNETYRNFGSAAARFDDMANWIPSRIAALLLIAAAGLTRMDMRGAARIWRRDRRNHASPNAAQTEAAAAGALGVQLAGNACYFGELYEKPTIGDPDRPIEREDIRRVNRLMYAGTAVMTAFFVLIHAAVWALLLI